LTPVAGGAAFILRAGMAVNLRDKHGRGYETGWTRALPILQRAER